MPGLTAADTVSFVRAHALQTRVVMLTAYHDAAAVRRLIGLGVEGYVLKDDAPEAVTQAIRSVAAGESWFSRRVVTELAHESAPARSEGPPLTCREKDLLELLEKGCNNSSVAAELKLGEQTVRNYLHQIYGKLGVASRTEAVVWLRDHDHGDRRSIA